MLPLHPLILLEVSRGLLALNPTLTQRDGPRGGLRGWVSTELQVTWLPCRSALPPTQVLPLQVLPAQNPLARPPLWSPPFLGRTPIEVVKAAQSRTPFSAALLSTLRQPPTCYSPRWLLHEHEYAVLGPCCADISGTGCPFQAVKEINTYLETDMHSRQSGHEGRPMCHAGHGVFWSSVELRSRAQSFLEDDSPSEGRGRGRPCYPNTFQRDETRSGL